MRSGSRSTAANPSRAIPTTANAVLSEAHRAWNRAELADLGKLYAEVAPDYGAAIESCLKAREARRHRLARGPSSRANTARLEALQGPRMEEPLLTLAPSLWRDWQATRIRAWLVGHEAARLMVLE